MSQRLERLINLVIALRDARVPMTADEIRSRVAGYGQDEKAAFRRMFERDKADLRSLGVPIRTVEDDGFGVEGYTIAAEDYELPPIALEADELAALALALHAVGEPTHSGLRKLEVDAPHPDPDELVPPPVSVALGSPHRDALLAAQLARRRVTFSYRPPGRLAEVRTVDPAGLVHRSGNWYVVGHDADRDARRAFRLDRIIGDVTETGEAAPVDPGVRVEDVLPDTEPVSARIAATADAEWLVARRADGPGRPGDDGRSVYEVGARDADELIGWVLRLGPEVEVLAPAELRARVAAACGRLAGR